MSERLQEGLLAKTISKMRSHKRGLAKYRRIRKVIVISLMLGIVLLGTSIGIFCYYILPSNLTNPTPDGSNDPYGFLLFSSEDVLESTNSYLLYNIDQIDCTAGNAHVRIDAQLFRSMANIDNKSLAIFTLQLFKTASDIDITINDQELSDIGGTKQIVDYPPEGMSYIVFNVPNTEIGGSIRFTIDFIWHNAFCRYSYYEYGLVLSFNSGFPNYIYNVQLPQRAIYGNGLILPDMMSRSSVSISKPSNVVLTSSPNVERTGFSYGQVWNSWDLKNMSDRERFASVGAIIDFQVTTLKDQYDFAVAILWLLLGIAIPLIVSSFIELLKLSKER
jgi:hypothetical protein